MVIINYKIFSILLLIFLLFKIIYSQVLSEDTYDPCAYVGTSNQPELPEFCLNTSSQCCYFAFKWDIYVYYSCINKNRLILTSKKKNMTASFIMDSADDVYPILNNIMYSNCSDNSDVVVSAVKKIPPSLGTNQRLLFESEEYTENYSNNFLSVLKYLFLQIKLYLSSGYSEFLKYFLYY